MVVTMSPAAVGYQVPFESEPEVILMGRVAGEDGRPDPQ
jgi:hypothetical protein